MISYYFCRVQDYIKSGLATKYLRDPDGGINLLKKKAHLGVLDNADLEPSPAFPKEGFSCDLSGIPRVTFGNIWRYMIDCVETKKQLSTAKPLVKGYNFYRSGHVLFISHRPEKGKHYLKSQVLPSMKKKAVYTCYIVMTSIGNELRAQCGCPAGVDGRCNHVTATLFALDEYCKQRVKASQDSSDLSCTSKPCKWNVPRKRKGSVVSIANMQFSKHDYAKPQKKRKSFMTPGHDVRALDQRTWPEDRVKNMLNLVKEYQEKTDRAVGWLHILLQDVRPQTVEQGNETDEANVDLLPPVKEHPVSISTLRERCQEVERKLNISESEIYDIERMTRGQSNNTWYSQRRVRITASKCHRVAAMKESTSPTKAVQEILHYNTPYQSQSMKQGLEQETSILENYKKMMHEKGNIGLDITQCGFFVSKDHGFLGASPDALVDDPSIADTKGLVEIKYVQMNEDESLHDALLRKRVCVIKNKDIQLNASHQYYNQIQQQMFVTQGKWTDFVVSGSQSNNHLFCQRVFFSEEFWNAVLPKLLSFFQRWVAPEIAYPRIKYGLPKLDLRSL